MFTSNMFTVRCEYWLVEVWCRCRMEQPFANFITDQTEEIHRKICSLDSCKFSAVKLISWFMLDVRSLKQIGRV